VSTLKLALAGMPPKNETRMKGIFWNKCQTIYRHSKKERRHRFLSVLFQGRLREWPVSQEDLHQLLGLLWILPSLDISSPISLLGLLKNEERVKKNGNLLRNVAYIC